LGASHKAKIIWDWLKEEWIRPQWIRPQLSTNLCMKLEFWYREIIEVEEILKINRHSLWGVAIFVNLISSTLVIAQHKRPCRNGWNIWSMSEKFVITNYVDFMHQEEIMENILPPKWTWHFLAGIQMGEVFKVILRLDWSWFWSSNYWELPFSNWIRMGKKWKKFKI